MKTVIKRLVFYIQIQLESPLNVASGEDEWTDADILLDFDGNPFVPGSSLAGAMRSYIGEKDNEWELFGFSKDDIEGKMSPLLISDLVFDQEPVIGVRDGVGLNEKKVVKDGCKFGDPGNRSEGTFLSGTCCQGGGSGRRDEKAACYCVSGNPAGRDSSGT